ncbi:dephospho-CoA kinase [Aureisphaera galaxeae]|uniref:dephospho-CoA kinase n=1 Tax=Aureisphaera galaxeae TaxID=1538023 RepID=UPI00235077BE|nr:dephospho-CoA kinase [Aureisphaera galaxeae]MDC8004963.1 dephospho-CoA kinase [Aureisphaera galaxeae]
MKVVGLTGGIGSGKSTVATMFAKLGIPVYIADIEAKKLTNRSKVIRRKLIALLGEETYIDGSLNREYVAQKIFNDTTLLQQVNGIIHPKVGQHFKRWLKKQEGSYCIKEAAILFENGGYKNCDYTVLVTAPKDIRIQRVMQRDATTREAIERRMANQWTDEEKIPLSNFHIENIDLVSTQSKVEEIHNILQNS